mgnify:CR=1 FL=1
MQEVAEELGDRALEWVVLAGGFRHRTVRVRLRSADVVMRFAQGDPSVEAAQLILRKRKLLRITRVGMRLLQQVSRTPIQCRKSLLFLEGMPAGTRLLCRLKTKHCSRFSISVMNSRRFLVGMRVKGWFLAT